MEARLKSCSYETKEGEKRTVIELEVDEMGPSLRYAIVPRGFMKADGFSDGNSSVEDWVQGPRAVRSEHDTRRNRRLWAVIHAADGYQWRKSKILSG